MNVFGWDKGLYPVRIYNSEPRTHNVDLLLLVNGENHHYVWIKDLSRLYYNNSKHKERKHVCRHCLHVFTTKDLLDEHVVDCKGIGMKPQRIEMPAEGKNILQFKNHHKQLQVPYVIYADFECFNVPVEGLGM